MNDRDRLEHLRGLLDRLERMPTSADRDWMLSEVHARAVDVETGVSPAAVRALPEGDAPAEIAPQEESGFSLATRRRSACRPVRRARATSNSSSGNSDRNP